MNFLAHHAVALASAAQGAESPEPEFYVGNVLPDLISLSGISRVRPSQLNCASSALSTGMALHLECDRRFHGLSAFAEAQRVAKALLLSAPFEEPPRRTFFLTHVIVEIALDRFLLSKSTEIAVDLYSRFENASLQKVVHDVEALLLTSNLDALRNVLDCFVARRFLFDYAESAGCAEAVHRICRRARLIGFPTLRSQAILAGIFEAFRPTIELLAASLLTDS